MDIAAINECVDSFSTNLHKWGLVQFDCSPLHVKDRGAVSDDCVIVNLRCPSDEDPDLPRSCRALLP